MGRLAVQRGQETHPAGVLFTGHGRRSGAVAVGPNRAGQSWHSPGLLEWGVSRPTGGPTSPVRERAATEP
ncbi:hypothetical protein CyaNS01_02597 [Cyanobium sp. NS01]|nr:hypothetical protein CyaNS01_02597 [Cyanobium sp. NS01]